MATVLKSVPTMAEDDGVRERHGVSNGDGSYVSAIEYENTLISVTTNDGQYSSKSVTISPAKARHLAGRLYRLARRIERRELSA